ncbi:hypothetical protein AGOR_G00137160 [Albula goreensis]|uniref:Uncharacterized protein n=1 Tax=Albula goreensis TaxID=1534307 RepID=A0A8T3D7T6_9TELE|nr:hypothetical protein AGOR_G00137160 [Albula goreensis]
MDAVSHTVFLISRAAGQVQLLVLKASSVAVSLVCQAVGEREQGQKRGTGDGALTPKIPISLWPGGHLLSLTGSRGPQLQV